MFKGIKVTLTMLVVFYLRDAFSIQKSHPLLQLEMGKKLSRWMDETYIDAI